MTEHKTITLQQAVEEWIEEAVSNVEIQGVAGDQYVTLNPDTKTDIAKEIITEVLQFIKESFKQEAKKQ